MLTPFALQQVLSLLGGLKNGGLYGALAGELSRNACRVPLDVGLAPSAASRPPPPPCALGPHRPTSLGRPLPKPCKKSQGGWGEEGRRGRGGKGFGLREGSSNYNGGWGGPPVASICVHLQRIWERQLTTC